MQYARSVCVRDSAANARRLEALMTSGTPHRLQTAITRVSTAHSIRKEWTPRGGTDRLT
jgi:hypothetical protein